MLRALSWSVGILALPLAAAAQLVTPPPTEAPGNAEPLVIWPTTPPPPEPPPKITPLTPEEMARAVPVERRGGVKSTWPKKEALPKTEYKSLVEHDKDGKLLPLSEPMDLAALRRNPLLPAGFMTSGEVTSYLAGRAAAYRRLAVENLDICESVDNGYIEKTDIMAKDMMKEMVNRLRPISPSADSKSEAGLLVDMYLKKMLTAEQAAFADMISKEYSNAQFRGRATNDVIRQVMENGAEEAMWAYHDVIAEAPGKFRTLVPQSSLDAAKKAEVMKAVAEWKSDLPRDQKIKVYRNATAGLTFEERQALLRTMIAK
jgi:hypothetical protein